MNTQSIAFKILAPVIGLAIMTSLALLFWVPRIVERNVVNQARASAIQTSQQMKTLRGYYVKNVVSKAKARGLSFGIQHTDNPEMLPLPATMIHELSQAFEKDGTHLQLYSAFPFPNRRERRLDDFAQNAWDKLAADSKHIATRLETRAEGQRVLRVAIADTMSAPACVACHNSDPNSPKKDWKMDQTRGVLEVQQDVTQEINEGVLIGRIVALSVAAALTLIALVLFSVYRRSVKTPLKLAETAVENIAQGRFDIEIRAEGQDEISAMVNRIALAQRQLKASMGGVNEVVAAIAKGDFSRRIDLDMQGDFLHLKEGVNSSVDAIQQVMGSLLSVMTAIRAGDFGHQVNVAAANGEFKLAIDQALQAMAAMRHSIGDVLRVTEGMRQGNFSQRIEINTEGDFRKLAAGVNASMSDIENALQAITRVVTAQARGDLTQSIQQDFPGALGRIKESVNTSVQQLNATVAEILSVSEMVATASHEVSAGASSLSNRTQQMSASLEEAAASMEEIGTTVNANTASAQQANRLSGEARSGAEKGGEVAHQAVDAMHAISQSSQRIADIITLIDGISFQTNILALNAAVEAARAGEHGRGFAVVAGEVRALAQRAADASKEIKALIDQSSANVSAGTAHVTETGKSLESLNQTIGKVTGIITEITAASSEQAIGIDQISKVMTELTDITQHNAALVEETSASAQSLSNQASQLRALTGVFRTV